MKLTFNGKYLFLSIIVFLIELAIALFVKDRFVRPFLGDVLVVVLIYCAVRIFLNVNFRRATLGVFLFACAIEILQYFDYVRRLGLEDNRILSVALGRTFEWLDFAAYFAGFLLILLFEKFYERD
ncbi:MAG TPA: DUF2809 domain-containing protein [Pyrinomonadaceae bacterium]